LQVSSIPFDTIFHFLSVFFLSSLKQVMVPSGSSLFYEKCLIWHILLFNMGECDSDVTAIRYIEGVRLSSSASLFFLVSFFRFSLWYFGFFWYIHSNKRSCARHTRTYIYIYRFVRKGQIQRTSPFAPSNTYTTPNRLRKHSSVMSNNIVPNYCKQDNVFFNQLLFEKKTFKKYLETNW
jgi:hypothetical protein